MVFCSSLLIWMDRFPQGFCSHQYPAKGQRSEIQTKWHLLGLRDIFLINCFGLWEIHLGQDLPLTSTHRYAAFIESTVIDPKQWLLSLHSPTFQYGEKTGSVQFQIFRVFVPASQIAKVGESPKLIQLLHLPDRA